MLSWVDSLLQVAAPWRCVLCLEAAQGMDICINCLDDLPWLGHTCRHCGLPTTTRKDALCGHCAQAAAAPLLSRCLAPLRYEFPVSSLVQALKYGGRRVYARVLGELLAICVHEEFSAPGFCLPDLLLPVPLHPWRQLRRGFNQAADIAYWLAREHRLQLDSSVLRRQRLTVSQTGLSKTARLANMRGAFRVAGDIRGKRVAVVDDVVTTAATSNELARVLRNSGASDVQVWAVARKV